MSETGEIPIHLEKNELLKSSNIIERPNAYKGRGEPLSLIVDNKISEWHSVKGGTNNDQQNPHDISYEILFNSDTKQWLKIIPPETKKNMPHYNSLKKRLRKSTIMARHALEVAELPELINKIKDCEIEVKNEQVYGFVSPHLGPSVEYYIERITGSKLGQLEVGSQEQELFSNIYSLAFDQAAKLYLRYGEWTSDPNPGNLILYDSPNTNRTHVVLIDFANSKQTGPNGSYLPIDKLSQVEYKNKMMKVHEIYLSKLATIFTDKCQKRGIPFSVNLDYYKQNSIELAKITP